jgi:serine protease Do
MNAETQTTRRARWHRAVSARGVLLAMLLAISACTAPGGAVARNAPDSFSPLVKKVLPAVVNIAVTETVSSGDMLNELPPELRDTPLGREFRRRFGNRREQQ